MKRLNFAFNKHTKLGFAWLLIILLTIITSCTKNPTGSDGLKVICEGGCYSMSWDIEGETGSCSYNETCTYDYTTTGDYIQTCTGTRTYSNSGNSYNYTVTYDWPDCKITVNVENVGSCSN
jgi:hypothetical protein